MEPSDDNISQCSDESLVLIRINVPDLGVQKCMQFHRDELVWDVKQQVLAALPKEMKESFNCGLYCPPLNGRAGKFLDEERPLSDYPFPAPVGYLELKYKRRVYKMLNVDEKQIKQLHTRANLRRLLDFVQGGQAEKISKLCAKGLDPNFHCQETGETPLSLASAQKKCSKTILALANGGALLDYRTRDGVTALHKAVEKNNLEAVKTLLDLGASPNYRDNKGLTPLYYSVLYNADSHLCELLLHDHAAIGAADLQGWQEVHQACRNGLIQHLEHLLFYGADMNARNASGNTPLHVCAVNEQESCARVLLFRGTDKEALNFANQTPYQVAVIAGNLGLAEVINNHRPEDVVPFREPPKYNPRRRASIASSSALNRTHSDPRLEITLGIKPPSPSPSNRSLPPFSSASSLSETSTGSSSTCTQPSNEDSEDTASVSVITEKSVASDSSGVCVSQTCASGGYESYPERPAPMDIPLVPGLMCVCLENYSSDLSEHLILAQGDIIEVTGSTDCGLLEGIFKGQRGFFPAACVQEVRLRHPELRCPSRRVEGRRGTNARQCNNSQQQVHIQPQIDSPLVDPRRVGEPRTVVLHKGKKGFGFVLRGAKATSPLMELQPSDNCPALQYLDDVDRGGVADLAGLKRGDFLLAINGEDVSQASHEHVVNLIRKSGELVAMSVVTLQRGMGSHLDRPQTMAARQCATLPRKLMRGKAAPVPPRRDPRTTLSVGRARARSMVAGLAEIEALDRTLLEYDSEGRSTKSSSIESLPNKQLRSSDSLPFKSHITLGNSMPVAKRVTAAELQDMFANQNIDPLIDSGVLHSPKVYGSVAQMKRYKASKHKLGDSPSKIHKVFHSTPDLNEVEMSIDNIPTNVGSTEHHRRSHSQEDMAVIRLNGRNVQLSWSSRVPTMSDKAGDLCDSKGPWHSIEEIYNRVVASEAIEDKKRSGPPSDTGPPHPPPPTHPPPPPPVGQVVRVDVSRSRSEYAKVTVASDGPPKPTSVMSSFRPGDSAKLYASPQEIGIIGYHAPSRPPTNQPPAHKAVSSASLRSRSLPPNVPPPPKTSSPSSSTSSETETSGDSASYTCSTFKKPCPQTLVAPDAVSTDSGHSSERGSHTSVVQSTTNPYAQPVVPYHHQRPYCAQQPPHLPTHNEVEPYIPEPDYDISDEEETQMAPPPPPPPIKPPQQLTEQSPPPFHVLDSGQSRPQSGEKKKPPTPPIKRRDKTGALQHVPSSAQNHVVKQTGSVTTVKSSTPVGSPSSSSTKVVLLGMAKGKDSGSEVTDSRPVTGKPPPTGAKIVKACSTPVTSAPTSANHSASSSPSAVIRSETVGGSDFKLLIAKKAAERQRRASLTSDSTVPSPDSPKKEEILLAPPPVPIVAAKEAPEEPVAKSVITTEEDVVSEPTKEEMVINVKEQISAFEKKVESVKTPPSIVRTVAIKKPEDQRKILKGSHSQIFEAKILEKVHLKPSKSCPHDLTQDQDADNSSSGVSSDVDVQNEKNMDTTSRGRGSCLTEGDSGDSVKKEEESDDSDDLNDPALNLKAKISETSSGVVLREDIEASIASRRILTKNVVSLARLPPPIETGETDAESDITEPTPPAESFPGGGGSFDSSFNGSEPSSPDTKAAPTLTSSSKVSIRPLPVAETHPTPPPAQSSSLSKVHVVKRDENVKQIFVRDQPRSNFASKAAEEKIQQSMNLIKMHANSLQAVNSLAGLVPPPPEFDERTMSNDSDFSMIAPPPEFSDDIHVPIKKDRRSMLEDAEAAAKSAAAALAAAAGGIHLSCPAAAAAAAAASASKLPTVRQGMSGGVIQKSHPHGGQMKPPSSSSMSTNVSVRQMVRPSNTKVCLPPGTCNGVPPDEYHHHYHPHQPQHPHHHPHLPMDQGPPPYLGGPVKLKSRPPSGMCGSAGPPPTTPAPPPPYKEFRTKPMLQWNTRDVSDWLESLLLPEYKARFEAAGVDGRRLTYLDNNSLAELGVKRVGHRMNIERSLRRHSMMKQ